MGQRPSLVNKVLALQYNLTTFHPHLLPGVISQVITEQRALSMTYYVLKTKIKVETIKKALNICVLKTKIKVETK